MGRLSSQEGDVSLPAAVVEVITVLGYDPG